MSQHSMSQHSMSQHSMSQHEVSGGCVMLLGWHWLSMSTSPTKHHVAHGTAEHRTAQHNMGQQTEQHPRCLHTVGTSTGIQLIEVQRIGKTRGVAVHRGLLYIHCQPNKYSHHTHDTTAAPHHCQPSSCSCYLTIQGMAHPCGSTS
jgi:hypothetical protein